jgi:hypothetical protein
VLAATLAAAVLTGGCHHDDSDALSVVVTLPEQHLTGVAKATIEVDYSGAGASILSENGGPSCAFILPGVEGDFADDRKGKLTIRAQGPRAARGQADLAACRMKAGDHNASAADLKKTLTIKLASAEDAAGKPVDLAAKAGSRSAGASPRKDAEIEAAQAEAAKTAAVVPTPPAAAPGSSGATGAVTGSAPVVMPAPAAAAPIVMPAPTGVIPKTPPRPVASGPSASARAGAATVPSGQPYGNGGEGTPNPPGSQDKDPGYDDSDGDNNSLPAYDLEVGVTTPGRLGALQLKITHLGSSGGFVGRNDQLDCTPTVDAMMAQNWPGERTAQIGLINIQGFSTPASVVRCGFRSREALSPNSFLVEVVDASDVGTGTDGDPKPLDPEPTAVILSINRR